MKLFNVLNAELSSFPTIQVDSPDTDFRSGAFQVTLENIGRLAIIFESELMFDFGEYYITFQAQRPTGSREITLRPGDWLVARNGDELHRFPHRIFCNTFDYAGKEVPVSIDNIYRFVEEFKRSGGTLHSLKYPQLKGVLVEVDAERGNPYRINWVNDKGEVQYSEWFNGSDLMIKVPEKTIVKGDMAFAVGDVVQVTSREEMGDMTASLIVEIKNGEIRLATKNESLGWYLPEQLTLISKVGSDHAARAWSDEFGIKDKHVYQIGERVKLNATDEVGTISELDAKGNFLLRTENNEMLGWFRENMFELFDQPECHH